MIVSFISDINSYIWTSGELSVLVMQTWVVVCDGAVLRHLVGNPKRKVWGAQQQVSLSCETKCNIPGRRTTPG
jgi:hypothetical protein